MTGGRRTAKIYSALLTEAFIPVLSSALLDELLVVLERPVFELTQTDIERVLLFFNLHARFVQPQYPIRVCRDPTDDKFLECALAARVACLVTGDQDLLTLHPFHGIPIVSPRVFIEHFLS